MANGVIRSGGTSRAVMIPQQINYHNDLSVMYRL